MSTSFLRSEGRCVALRILPPTLALLTLFIALQGASAQLIVAWDDGATENPPEGDGVSWNDKKNWEDDILPSGVVGAAVATDVVRVQDGLQAFAASLDAGTTTLELNGQLTINGDFSSDGMIIVFSESDSPGSGAGLSVGIAELEGEAEIILRSTEGPGVLPAVFSAFAGPVTISEDYEIRGEGRAGTDAATPAVLINNGLVIAEDRDMNPGSNLRIVGVWTNNSIISTSPTATARITAAITQDAGGRLVADTNDIDFTLGVLVGGSLETENGGHFTTTSDSTIRDVTVNAPIDVKGGFANDLFIGGEGITNNSVITISSDNVGLDANLVLQGTATLSGTGVVVLAKNGDASLFGPIGSAVTQAAGHTIRGEGSITAELVNNGVIEAVDINTDGDNTLLIRNNSNGSAGPTNNNLYRAADGAVLEIIAHVTQSAAGRIVAADGGFVRLRSAEITGGALNSEGAGAVELISGSTLIDVTNEGALNIPGGGSEKVLTIRGTSFVNDGVVTASSTGAGFGGIVVDSTLTLSGDGEIFLARPINASTLSITAGETVTQAAGHTIRGRGQVRGTSGTLINNGVMAGLSGTEMLDVDSILAGEGLLRDVFIDGIHAPGNPQLGQPTALAPIEGQYNFGNGPGINGANRLELEIGGTAPGDDYDQLVSTDASNVVTIRTVATTLDLSIINGFMPTVGDKFTLIDTAGSITGDFATELLPTIPNFALSWNLEYTAQQLTLELLAINPLPGDYNADGVVSALDYALWRETLGATGLSPFSGADGDGDGDITSNDFTVWIDNYGAEAPASASPTPEPTSTALLCLLLGAVGLPRRTRSGRHVHTRHE